LHCVFHGMKYTIFDPLICIIFSQKRFLRFILWTKFISMIFIIIRTSLQPAPTANIGQLWSNNRDEQRPMRRSGPAQSDHPNIRTTTLIIALLTKQSFKFDLSSNWLCFCTHNETVTTSD
jgi:magnesium-transporting ATPase (P-type)